LRLGERYLAQVLRRWRLIFSIEAVLICILIWGSLRIADRMGIESPSRWENNQLFILHQIGFYIFISIIALTVYSAGEFTRRKFKLKSIIFYDTNDNEIKQRIVSLIEENPNMSSGEISDILMINVEHAEEYIQELKKSGVI